MNEHEAGGACSNNNEKSAEGSSDFKQQSWRGCTMSQIHRNLNEFDLDHVAAARPSEKHTVLHAHPIRTPLHLPPAPYRCHHKWDDMHVRLPCSSKSQYPVTSSDGGSSIESRWEMIQLSLLRPITNSQELQAAILSYNSKYENSWNFRALHELFEKKLNADESRVFFEDLLPRIIRLALRLPELVQAPIPLLKQGQTHAITLTQEQISCLLANAFLCTFPRRNTMKRKSEYSTFPDINFNRLFQSTGSSVHEKIKCICHYFRRVCPTDCSTSNVPNGAVTFLRRCLQNNELPLWAECDAPLGCTPLHIAAEGTIEDQGLGLLQVDFANKYLGGGVLGSGCVQEEIRFVICPELLISKLFTECLRPTEALLMIGAERYSNYQGYASTFQWSGNYQDRTPKDSSRRRKTHIVAIDALAFHQPAKQYNEELMLRELNKAYVGFYHPLPTPAPGVASGNWGCGAFGGEATLKALLQLMVCTVVQRPLVYYTFGNSELRDKIYNMHTFFIENNVRVKDLWSTLKKFESQRLSAKELYNFIYSCLRPKFGGNNFSKIKLKALLCCQQSPTSQKTPLSPIDMETGTSQAICQKKKFSQQAKSLNTSRDPFLSSSDEDEPSVSKSFGGVESSKTSLNIQKVNLSLSDDSETEALLLAAVDETHIANSSFETKKNSYIEKDNASPLKKRPELRQRNLLEMLDQAYGENSPASKRYCIGKTNQKD